MANTIFPADSESDLEPTSIVLAPPTASPLGESPEQAAGASDDSSWRAVTEDDEEVTRVEVNETAIRSSVTLEDVSATTFQLSSSTPAPPTESPLRRAVARIPSVPHLAATPLWPSARLPAPTSPWSQPRVNVVPPGSTYGARAASPVARPLPPATPAASVEAQPRPPGGPVVPTVRPSGRWSVAFAAGLIGFLAGGLFYGGHISDWLSAAARYLAHRPPSTSAEAEVAAGMTPAAPPPKVSLSTPPKALDAPEAAPSPVAPVVEPIEQASRTPPVRRRPKKVVIDEVVLTATD